MLIKSPLNEGGRDKNKIYHTHERNSFSESEICVHHVLERIWYKERI